MHDNQPPAGPKPEELPPWLRPGSSAVQHPPSAHRAAVAWTGTLACTILMVAFGLWLGNTKQPLAAKVAATPSAPELPAVMPTAAPAPVPPLVLAAPSPALSVAAPQVVKTKSPRKDVIVAKKATPPRKRHTALSAAAQGRQRGGAMPAASSQRWSAPIAVAAPSATPRMRCKRGELARECLARYQ